jgi:RNA polymerase sigma-70 factor (ECF subfamily)
VQEAFLKAFRRLTQFQEKSKFSTWLIRITISEALMRLRKHRSIKDVPMDLEFHGEEAISPFEVVDSTQNIEERYQGSEVQHLLRSALQNFSPQ